jgi:hypothetical protein
MTTVSCNCIVCAEEFDPADLQSIALSKINVTNFKVCQACLDSSDPAEDYRQVREVVDSYLKFAEARTLFTEVKSILDSRKDGYDK